jgi:hypothetical protein
LADCRENITVPHYPRLIGETGGKDLSLPIVRLISRRSRPRVRGAYEYQGQTVCGTVTAVRAAQPLAGTQQQLIDLTRQVWSAPDGAGLSAR